MRKLKVREADKFVGGYKARDSVVAQMGKNLPTIWEIWVRSLGREDSLEKGIATHSNTLAWRIPRTEEPDRLQSTGLQRVRYDWAINTAATSKCGI